MDKPNVTIKYYTDPLCSWSWASEPALRKLKSAYGKQVSIQYIMGGMIRDVNDFSDPQNQIANSRDVADCWRRVAASSGMPFADALWEDDPPSSTYPANIAVKAVQLIAGRELSEAYLRRLREQAFCWGKNISRQDVQTEVAQELGIDPEEFQRQVCSEQACDLFKADLLAVKQDKVYGFPTMIIENQQKHRVRISGHRPFRAIERIMEQITTVALKRRDQEHPLDYIVEFGTVTTQELAVLAGLARDSAEKLLADLLEEQLVTKIEVAGGVLWGLPQSGSAG